MKDYIRRSEINTGIPVHIQAIPNSKFNAEHDNKFITHAKLQMFYVGETADKRAFTKEFSDRVLQTLPQSPVVGYYDEDAEDFKAHNTKQYVYGYVPKQATIEFQQVDGALWAFTDVVLFTGRKDNIGDVAKKIIGRQHSLELDPDTVEYKVNRDDEGKFVNVEFIDAQFIGLSVVGDAETPAFTGSHFFTEETGNKMKEAFTTFATEIDKYFEGSMGKDGGVKMDKFLELFGAEFLPKLHNYMKETYEERMQGVYEALTAANQDTFVIVTQMNDSTAVYLDYFEGNFYRVDYSITENEEGEKEYSFSEKVEVKPRYLTNEEINGTFTNTDEEEEEESNEEEEENNADDQSAENFTEEENSDNQEDAHDDNTEEENNDDDSNEDNNENFTEESNEDNNEGDADNNEESQDNNNAAFSDSEREEFEALRKEKKEEILESYKDFIEATELERFRENLADYTAKTLEQELSLVAMKKVIADKKKLEEENNSADAIIPFKIMNNNKGHNDTSKTAIQSLVDEYKQKN